MSQAHLFVKLGAGEQSELPVSPASERDNSAALCAADDGRCGQMQFDGNFLLLILQTPHSSDLTLSL